MRFCKSSRATRNPSTGVFCKGIFVARDVSAFFGEKTTSRVIQNSTEFHEFSGSELSVQTLQKMILFETEDLLGR